MQKTTRKHNKKHHSLIVALIHIRKDNHITMKLFLNIIKIDFLGLLDLAFHSILKLQEGNTGITDWSHRVIRQLQLES